MPSQMVHSLISIFQNIPEGYSVDLDIRNRQLVQRSRNDLIGRAYTEGYDYLFQIDDDNPMPSETLKFMLEDLADGEKHIVTGIIPGRHKTAKGRYTLCIMEEDVNDYGLTYYKNMYTIPDEENLFEVDNCWTWCILIDKSVIRFMYERYGQFPYMFKYDMFRGDGKKKKLWERFDLDNDIMDKDETLIVNYYSEDLMFFHRARKDWNFKVWCDPRCKWMHISDNMEIEVDDSFTSREITTSVIMPVYNWIEMTKACLLDLQRNLTTKHEIIIINDGSTDTTKEVLEGLIWYVPNLRVINHDTNLGVNYSWNEWVRNSRGKYCLVINNDILVNEGIDQKLINSMELSWCLCVWPMTFDNPWFTENPQFKTTNIIWHCFLLKKDTWSEMWDIPHEKLKLWFGDDWIFHRCKDLKERHALGIATKARCFHYGSMTLDENKAMFNPVLMADMVTWKSVLKEHGRQDQRDWPTIMKKLWIKS